MKKLFGFISFLSIFSLSAQTVKIYGIPLDSVKIWTQKHPKYFMHLKKKLLKTDAKMSQEELFMAYYGDAFMKGYNPKLENREVEQVTGLIDRFLYKEAIEKGEELLKQFPLSTRLYMLLGYAYKKIGQKNLSKSYYKRFANILNIPLHSGDGKSFEKAYIVRSFTDEYLIMNQNDWELSQQRIGYHQKMPFDEMKIMHKGEKKASQKIFFNVYLPFFVAENRTFSKELEHAIKVFKIDTLKNRIKKKEKKSK